MILNFLTMKMIRIYNLTNTIIQIRKMIKIFKIIMTYYKIIIIIIKVLLFYLIMKKMITIKKLMNFKRFNSKSKIKDHKLFKIMKLIFLGPHNKSSTP